MPDLKERLARAARRRLNKLQDRIQDFEQGGGVETLRKEFRSAVREVRTRIEQSDIPLAGRKALEVRGWYEKLGLPPGSGEAEVRRAYRDLMRQYHPDRFTGDPESERMATERAQEYTVAYEGLLRHLGAKPRQR